MKKIRIRILFISVFSFLTLVLGVFFTIRFVVKINEFESTSEALTNFNNVYNPFYGYNLIDSEEDLDDLNLLQLTLNDSIITFSRDTNTIDKNSQFISADIYRVIRDAVNSSDGIYQTGDSHQVLELHLQQNGETYPFVFRVFYSENQTEDLLTINYVISNIEISELYLTVDENINLDDYLTRTEIYSYELGLRNKISDIENARSISLLLFIIFYSLTFGSLLINLYSYVIYKNYSLFDNYDDAVSYYKELNQLKLENNNKQKEKIKIELLNKKKNELEELKRKIGK